MNDVSEESQRLKVQELQRRIDEKEKQWGDFNDRLGRVVSHLSHLAEAPDTSGVLAGLGQVREGLAEKTDLSAVEALLDTLCRREAKNDAGTAAVPAEASTLMDTLRRRVKSAGRAAAAQAGFPPVNEILLSLVQRLPLPAEIASFAGNLAERLKGGIAPDGLHEVIDQITGLVLQLRTQMLQEKRELENFLEEITSRLQHFGAGLVTAHHHAEAGFESNRSLDKAVRAEMEGLERTARSSTGIDSLRTALSRSIETICRQLEAKTLEDQHREEALRAEVNRLQASVGHLEKELDENRERAKAAQEQSLYDPITGCFNRLAYEQRAAAEEERWRRYPMPLSLIVFDVDHFKNVNDNLGHSAGDKVLRAIAQIAGGQIRGADFFGRFGGEEFVALLPETNLDAACEVAEKVRTAVEAFRFHSSGKRIPITLSCGVAEFGSGDDVAGVFHRADKALYAAKSSGRNKTERAS